MSGVNNRSCRDRFQHGEVCEFISPFVNSGLFSEYEFHLLICTKIPPYQLFVTRARSRSKVFRNRSKTVRAISLRGNSIRVLNITGIQHDLPSIKFIDVRDILYLVQSQCVTYQGSIFCPTANVMLNN